MKQLIEHTQRALSATWKHAAIASLAIAGASSIALNATAQDSQTAALESQKTIQYVLKQDLQNQVDDLIEIMRSSRHFGWWNVAPLAESEIFFEENTTDGDLGIQFFLDGDAWDRVQIFSPDLKRMVDLKVRGNAREIGLTEVFSESAEPGFDELPREEFLALFDEGPHLMLAHPLEGGLLIGIAMLTKDLPEPVEITSPAPKEGDEEEIVVDAAEPLVIEWTTSPDPDAPDSVIEAYQVIVEKDEDDERLRVYSVDMLPTDSTVTLAPGFLEPGKAYKVEIIVVESSNNKSITELEFETEDEAK